MKKVILFIALIGLLASCSKSIEPISYGEDACTYCSMTIVDKGHSAQIVTNKGRNYKFDSSECMIHYLEEHQNESDMLHILSADYLNPGNLVAVDSVSFLISENIPSPMGAFLSAITNKEEAQKLQGEVGGELFIWKEINEKISKNNTHAQH